MEKKTGERGRNWGYVGEGEVLGKRGECRRQPGKGKLRLDWE